MKPNPSITNQDHSDEDKNLKPELPEQASVAKNAPKKKISKKKEPTKIEKETKIIGNKILDEGAAFGNQAKDIVLGTGREQEIKNLRLKKLERNKEVYLER
jgi:hypothetical protein